jgi:ubiquinone/menaquinone biosynthesis C-methylase UbiE
MTHKTHKFDITQVAKLDSAERRQIQDPELLFLHLTIEAGTIAADIGCGTGYYTFPLAEQVGKDGRVYGVDISQEMLSILEERIKEKKVINIEPVLSEEDFIPLPDASLDLVILATTFHEVDQREALLQEIRRVLKLGGQIINIDWEAKESPMGPPIEHRIPLEEAIKIFSAAGFKDINLLPAYQYLYVIQATN